MSDTLPVSEKVKQFIQEIIAQNGMKSSSSVEYGAGAELGEGFNSKTLTVRVKDDATELNLFLKMKSGLNWHESFDEMFANEILFYDTIYPAYKEFLKEHNVEDGFRNVPECYGTTSDIIALDNLKRRDFIFFDNKGLMNEEHILMVMKTLAKFHAISFAFKDQRKEIHDSFTRKIHPCIADIYRRGGFDKITSVYIKKLIKNLDPERDKVLLNASANLEQILIDALFNVDNNVNEYSIITQGDCWNNNILFTYNDENLDNPTDLMLLDWQLIRYGSPANDLGYFFYPMATDSTIEKFKYYMRIYYDELSLRLRQLGSDPEILYPFPVFEKEWKQCVKYGFAMSFIIVEGLLMEKEEIPNLQDNPGAFSDAEKIIPHIKNDRLLMARMKTILEHFVKHDFL